MNLAMFFIVRTDLNMSRGKIAAQVAHAAVDLTYHNKCDEWYNDHNQTKIVLGINGFDKLDSLLCRLLERKVFIAQVHDIGKTEVEENTLTCVGIGPIERKAIQKILSGLKALR